MAASGLVATAFAQVAQIALVTATLPPLRLLIDTRTSPALVFSISGRAQQAQPVVATTGALIAAHLGD
jgi:hypothetical protein